MERVLPTGTVTFLFTDIEGSTNLLHDLGTEVYAKLLADHRQLLREACARHDGVEVATQGDAVFVAFPTAPGALLAAREAQMGLAPTSLRVRMGLHTGRAHVAEGDYVGADVHLAARIASAAHGGQVVLSASTAALVGLEGLTELGEHRLKDFPEPMAIYQLGSVRFPPLRTISNTNLPRPASTFVGRQREVSEVAALLQDGARLLTLTGPGGTGKTRLAIETAAELVPVLNTGVFWVGLAALRDPTLVSQTIAQTLGAKGDLAEHIGERRMLLVLDNLEQVIASAPELASLVETCPKLKVLVTSRELLRVRGEVEYAVPPLTDSEAVELFCALSRHEPDETIAELCRSLDNLPLAIELAAARASILTPSQIVDRLSKRLDLFKGGRDALARQATLRATIEWSHDLLTGDERRLFARLSVFRGGCTLEAAEAVADADFDVLQALVDKSLLRHAKDRFFMLETIADYAAERLASIGEQATVRSRHADFLCSRFEQVPWTDEPAWIADLEVERDNLRAALSWAHEAGDTFKSLLLAMCYAVLCRSHGPLAEARAWLDAALETDEGRPDASRATALRLAGSLAEMQGDLEPAKAYGEASFSIAKEAGDLEGAGRALLVLGYIALDGSDYESAESLHRQALAAFRECGSDRRVRITLGMLGFDAIAQKDYDEARRVLEEALILSRIADDSRGVQVATANLGFVLVCQGRSEEARIHLRESLLLAHETSDVVNTSLELEDIAGLAAAQEDCEAAAVLLGGAAEFLEATGFWRDPVMEELRQQTIAILRQKLEGEDLRQSWERGRKMPIDELVAYAVDFVDSSGRG